MYVNCCTSLYGPCLCFSWFPYKRERTTEYYCSSLRCQRRTASLLAGGAIPTFCVLSRGDVPLPWRIPINGEIAVTNTRAASGVVGYVLRGLVQRQPQSEAHVRRTSKEVRDGTWSTEKISLHL